MSSSAAAWMENTATGEEEGGWRAVTVTHYYIVIVCMYVLGVGGGCRVFNGSMDTHWTPEGKKIVFDQKVVLNAKM